MPRSRWLDRHINDVYVKQAQKQGYVARSSYKLLEIDEKYPLIKKANSILELGASPGGWSQVILKHKKPTANLVCNDLLDMKVSVPNFVKGSFLEPEIVEELLAKNNGEKFDLILSDIAPNMTGIPTIDQCNMNEVLLNIFDFVENNLDRKGTFLFKMFMGAGSDAIFAKYKALMKNIKTIKPNASRKESAEVYCLGNTFRSV